MGCVPGFARCASPGAARLGDMREGDGERAKRGSIVQLHVTQSERDGIGADDALRHGCVALCRDRRVTDRMVVLLRECLQYEARKDQRGKSDRNDLQQEIRHR